MDLLFIRHAIAAEPGSWGRDDRLRPLAGPGRTQAVELIAAFADVSFQRIVSSPALRCVETIAPLAIARRTAIELDERLHQDARTSDLLEVIGTAADDATLVMCTHAQPLGSVLQQLIDGGAEVIGGVRTTGLANASAWHLRGRAGDVTSLRYIAPPGV